MSVRAEFTWNFHNQNDNVNTTSCSLNTANQWQMIGREGMLHFLITHGGTVATPPSGWAIVPGFTSSVPGFYIWYRVREFVQGTVFTWTQTASPYVCQMIGFSGMDPDDPIVGLERVKLGSLQEYLAVVPLDSLQLCVGHVLPRPKEMFKSSGETWDGYQVGWEQGGEVYYNALEYPNYRAIGVWYRSITEETRTLTGEPTSTWWGAGYDTYYDYDFTSFLLTPIRSRNRVTPIKYPATVVNSTITGGETDIGDWSNPGNAVSSNNTYATFTGPNTGHSTDWLKATGFNFSDNLPNSAIITGVEFFIERKHTLSGTTVSSGVRETVALVQRDSILSLGKKGRPRAVPSILNVLPSYIGNGGWTGYPHDWMYDGRGTADNNSDGTWEVPYSPFNPADYGYMAVVTLAWFDHPYNPAMPSSSIYGTLSPVLEWNGGFLHALLWNPVNLDNENRAPSYQWWLYPRTTLFNGITIARHGDQSAPSHVSIVVLRSVREIAPGDITVTLTSGNSSAISVPIQNPGDFCMVMGKAVTTASISATSPATSEYQDQTDTIHNWVWSGQNKTLEGAIDGVAATWCAAAIGVRGMDSLPTVLATVSPTDATLTAGDAYDTWKQPEILASVVRSPRFGVAYAAKIMNDAKGVGNTVTSVDCISGRVHYYVPLLLPMPKPKTPMIPRTFNGTTSKVELKNNLALTGVPVGQYDFASDLTIMAGVCPTGANASGFMAIVANCETDLTNGYRFGVVHNNGDPYFMFGVDSTESPLNTVTKPAYLRLSYGKYYDVAVVWNADQDYQMGLGYAFIYSVDATTGSFQWEYPINCVDGGGDLRPVTATTPFVIGNSPAGSHGFKGDIYYVAKWTRMLTIDELNLARKNGPLTVPGCLLFWTNGKDQGLLRMAETQVIDVDPSKPYSDPEGHRVQVSMWRFPFEWLGQHLFPVADAANGGWLPSVNGAALFEMLDETPAPDTSDYIYSPDSPVSEIADIQLTPMDPDPDNPDSKYQITYVLWAVGAPTTVTLSLVTGGTVLDTWEEEVPADGVKRALKRVLAPEVVATIPPGSTLRVVITAAAT